MNTKRRGFYRSTPVFIQRRGLSCLWNSPGPARNIYLHREIPECYRCGKNFLKNHLRSCPATRSTCFVCGKLGHFAKVCFSSVTTSDRSFPRIKRPLDSVVKTSTTQHSATGTGRACPQMIQSVESAVKLSANMDSTGRDDLHSNRVAAATLLSKCTKSASKRRRDSKRIQEYYARKQAFAVLPFNNLTTEEIKLELKSSNVYDHLCTINRKNKKLITKLSDVTKTCEQLKSELNTASRDKLFTKNSLLNSENKISALQRELAKLKELGRKHTTNNRPSAPNLNVHPILPFPTPPMYFQYQNARPRIKTTRK